MMISGLLSYFNPEESRKTEFVNAYIYASGLTMSIFGSLVIFHFSSLQMTHIGMKLRVACCATVFRKVCSVIENLH